MVIYPYLNINISDVLIIYDGNGDLPIIEHVANWTITMKIISEPSN